MLESTSRMSRSLMICASSRNAAGLATNRSKRAHHLTKAGSTASVGAWTDRCLPVPISSTKRLKKYASSSAVIPDG